MTGRQINFRPATFYLGIADMIARDVDGVSDEGDDGGSKAGAGVNVEPDTFQAKADLQTDRKTSDQAKVGKLRDPSSGSSSSGPTEMIFAADEGEVIDNVMFVRSPVEASHSSFRKTPPPATPLPKDCRFSQQHQTFPVSTISVAKPNTAEKNADSILLNWAALVSDSLSSLTSRSSSPSPRSSTSSSS